MCSLPITGMLVKLNALHLAWFFHILFSVLLLLDTLLLRCARCNNHMYSDVAHEATFTFTIVTRPLADVTWHCMKRLLGCPGNWAVTHLAATWIPFCNASRWNANIYTLLWNSTKDKFGFQFSYFYTLLILLPEHYIHNTYNFSFFKNGGSMCVTYREFMFSGKSMGRAH
jgi:hypothetical protein